MEPVKVAVIGVGGMGIAHVKSTINLEETQLVGVCDIVPEIAERVGAEEGVPWFTDYRRMYSKTRPDLVVIATPHPMHVRPAIDAMKRGIHVMCEKPIASRVSQADKMIDAAGKYGVSFGVMFQMRSAPIYRKAKEIIQSGTIGEIKRTHMVVSDYRTQAYYNSGSWRGKWSSEGGGVLLNQAPHHLDIFCWLGGTPRRVRGRVSTLLHDISVEDSASALLEYDNGAQGFFHASTVELPSTFHFEIAGDRGKIVVSGGKLRLATCDGSISQFTKETPVAWSSLNVEWQDVEIPEAPSGHEVMVRDMALAIREGRRPLAPGDEAIWSLELANAIILSGKTGKDVEFPVSRSGYDRLLRKLIADTEGEGVKLQ